MMPDVGRPEHLVHWIEANPLIEHHALYGIIPACGRRSVKYKLFLLPILALNTVFICASHGANMATASPTLKDRGNGLIYDTELDVTWLQNANVAEFGMTWNDAIAWVNAFVYAGLDDWRLPDSPATAQGFINEGELGHLYYTTLGNPALGPLENVGPFVNFPAPNVTIPPATFWLSATPLFPGSAWSFEFNNGFQNAASAEGNFWFVWPVRKGDVTAKDNNVPDAGSTLGLLAFALSGLSLLHRIRRLL
jgi:hypothetical protein